MRILISESQLKALTIDAEIEDLIESYSGEGVADRYMEKNFTNFYLPKDEFKDFEGEFKTIKQDEPKVKSEEKSKIVGFCPRFNKPGKPTRVYLNPKDLSNFDPNTRAISDINGNIFVAQLNGDFNHTSMGKSVNTLGVIKLGNPDDMTTHAHWHRINDTMSFGCSDTFWKYISDNHEDDAKKLQSAVQSKNPQFTFILKYWDGELITKKWKK